MDADAAAMARVLDRRAGASGRELSELVAAMLVMADTDGRRRGLRQVILSLLKEESIMESWVYKQGEQKGIEKVSRRACSLRARRSSCSTRRASAR